MRTLILLCDGMADTPVPQLGGKTPMQAAHKPVMDRLAAKSLCGMARTVPPGMAPGSDVANLSAMGYDPRDCYTGRSPLEAASMGLSLTGSQYAIRCNLVTLSDEPDYRDKTMADYCADDISTEEAAVLIRYLDERLPAGFRLTPGVSYRHCLVWENPSPDLGVLTPPHDISGRKIGDYLPDPEKAGPLLQLMEESVRLLSDHPVNLARIARGKRPANAIWLWGQGRRAALTPFREKTGLSASVISAVDLIKGIGILAGMEVLTVPGATGYLDTNFRGKAEAAIDAFRRGQQLVYLHLEAPDECGHRGEVENKVTAIERIDEEVLAPVLTELEALGDHRILILPDHPTPLDIRTHTADPVPWMLYDSRRAENGPASFTEENAAAGPMVDPGCRLMDLLLEKVDL